MKSGFSHRLGDGPGRGVVSVLVMALGLAGQSGCVVDIDLGSARLICSDGLCPDGFTCVEDRCVAEGEGAGQQEDAAPPEAPPDAAPVPDAPPPDAAPLACAQVYGAAPGFVLCSEDTVACQFFVATDVAVSCADLCLDVGGGSCVVSNNAPAGPPAPLQCVVQEETDCQVALNRTQLCTCTLGGNQ